MGLGFSIAAIMIGVTNIICCIIQKRTDKPNNRLFLTIMSILILNALNGCISSYTHYIRFESDTYFMFSRSFRYLYFITHACLFPVFFVYILNVCGITFLYKKEKLIIASLPFFVTEFMCLFNPITHWIYDYDINRVFHRNSGEFILYAAGVFYYVGAFGIAFKYWKTLSKKRKYVMAFSFLLIGAGAIIQLIFQNIRIEVLAEAIGFTGILMVIENEDDRMEPMYGVYNRSALEMDLATFFAHKETAGIIFIKIKNTDAIVRKMGASKIINLYSELANFLKEKTPWYHIYLATQQSFVLIVNKRKYLETAIDIQRRLFKPFMVDDTEIMVDSVILYDMLGKNIKKPSEVFYITDTPFLINEEEKREDDTGVDYYLRKLQVEKAVSRGLERNSFEVYYQPTFTNEGKLHGAEALLRMHDKELGDINPDEFIPAAENLGIIDQLDDFVLREVCEFFKTGIPQQGGISYINVNLSVLECIKDDFIDRIERTLAEFGIDKSCINFEITESAAVTDYDMLSNVIHHLKREGFHFSMDDFGTGYSNLQAAFSLGLDIIKIDKSILWAAEQNNIGKAILESNIGMIKKIGKEILVEGVETSSQVDLLKNLEADYLQGFYFSRPIMKKDFIKIIKHETKS